MTEGSAHADYLFNRGKAFKKSFDTSNKNTGRMLPAISGKKSATTSDDTSEMEVKQSLRGQEKEALLATNSTNNKNDVASDSNEDNVDNSDSEVEADYRSLSLELYNTLKVNRDYLDLTPSERSECATILVPLYNSSRESNEFRHSFLVISLIVSLILGVLLGQKIKF